MIFLGKTINFGCQAYEILTFLQCICAKKGNKVCPFILSTIWKLKFKLQKTVSLTFWAVFFLPDFVLIQLAGRNGSASKITGLLLPDQVRFLRKGILTTLPICSQSNKEGH